MSHPGHGIEARHTAFDKAVTHAQDDLKGVWQDCNMFVMRVAIEEPSQ